MNKFHELKTLEAATKESLLRTVRHHEIRLAAVDVYQDALNSIGLLLSFIAMIITLSSVYLYLNRVLRLKIADLEPLISSGGIKYTIASLVVALVSIMFPAVLASNLFSRRTLQFLGFTSFLRAWLVCCAVVFGGLLIRLHLQQPGFRELSIAAGLVGGIAFVLCVLGTLLIAVNIQNWFKRRTNDFHPDAVLTDSFLNLLWSVERPAVYWVDVKFRSQLIGDLETTAVCMERHLPRRLRTGHLVTDMWLKDRSEQMASGIRSLIKWLFTPQLNTREEFTKRVAANFVYAARGDWDSFELVQPERLSRPEVLRTRAKFILTAVFSAAVPIALLVLIKKLGAVAEPTLTYLTLGGYTWAALSLLASLDPNYSAKLSAMKDISQLLPFAKKDKD